MRTIAIVPAAGTGKRLKASCPKPLVLINNVPLIVHTLRALDSSGCFDEIVVVTSRGLIKKMEGLVKKYRIGLVSKVVEGGSVRARSVYNGLMAIKDKKADVVLIHDGARPCIGKAVIKESIAQARRHGASCVCVPVKPTIKSVAKGFITGTPDRKVIWEAQTPQAFSKELILKAYQDKARHRSATDDSSLVEALGHRVKVVPGSYSNIKVTTAEDLIMAGLFLKSI